MSKKEDIKVEIKIEPSKAIVEKPKTLIDFLNNDSFKLAVQQSVPKHLTPERFIRLAIMATSRVPKLKECEPKSVLSNLITLSALGLELDGRQAHLIPFFNNKTQKMECQLIIDWKGLKELVMNSGKVSHVSADVVCENDEFEYDRGFITKHKIDFKKPRGAMYAAYSRAVMKDGSEQAEVLSKDEVDAVRKRSKAAESGPWVTDYNEMAKKSAFRRLSKWLPMSDEVRKAIEVDDTQFEHVKFESPTSPKFDFDLDPETLPTEETK